MEITAAQLTLRELHTGSRLLVQCKKDWRVATVSRVGEEKITLAVRSPSGRTYRKSCQLETAIGFDGRFHFLGEGAWQIGIVQYDCRW
jgi:hypothetical protein